MSFGDSEELLRRFHGFIWGVIYMPRGCICRLGRAVLLSTSRFRDLYTSIEWTADPGSWGLITRTPSLPEGGGHGTSERTTTARSAAVTESAIVSPAHDIIASIVIV
ncbi:hypothetical protein V2G26_007769 [Clonostachys chloroleuca]